MDHGEDRALRKQLVEFLRGDSAHAALKTVLDGFPPDKRGVKPNGVAHTAWQLLEHIRIALHDLYDFSTNPKYVQPDWPADYWPKEEAPPSDGAWDESVRAVKKELADFEQLIGEPQTNLYATIPWGQGQTMLREVLLAGQHTSYHLGQLVSLRRELGAWEG
ncbi:MAG TPA: DinB family protein [Acidobacteriaceae bacterium]|nr:DinB family protein [Acidobacteriaceae bacterium]